MMARELLAIKGLGDKIADYVLLFAFGKLESFPVDTYIEEIMVYGSSLKVRKGAGERSYG